MRYQQSRKGHRRERLSATAERQIARWIRREADRYNVSRSFVIAVCVAEQAGIDIGEHYAKKRSKR